MAEDLMSTVELAEQITMHPDTIRRWVQYGSVTPTSVTPNGYYRWGLDDLRDQINAPAGVTGDS